MTSKDTTDQPDDCDRPDVDYRDSKRRIIIDLSWPEWVIIAVVAASLACGGWLF